MIENYDDKFCSVKYYNNVVNISYSNKLCLEKYYV